MTRSRLINVLRDAAWLDRGRVAAWGAGLLILETALLAYLTLWQTGFLFKVEVPTSIDFVSFYAAGKLVLAGTPALAYDRPTHYLAQQLATVPGGQYQFFFYPPVFLLLCAGLASLPYIVAYALFEAVTLALFLGVIRRVLQAKDWTWLPAVLAFPAIFWNLGEGQNAFLTAALFGGFTLLIDRRPTLAGLLLGMMCYKPHFGMLAPFALIAGRRWRAFLAASVTTVLLVGLSILLFGWETWAAYFRAFSVSDAVYASGRVDFEGMITPFGAFRLLGFQPGTSYVGQAVVALLMAGLTVVVWRRSRRPALRNASLLAATLLSVPLALVYDQLLLLVAIAWLVRDARETGFMPWEKILLLGCYAASLLIWIVGRAWQIPIGPFISAVVLSLCLRRIWLMPEQPNVAR